MNALTASTVEVLRNLVDKLEKGRWRVVSAGTRFGPGSLETLEVKYDTEPPPKETEE